MVEAEEDSRKVQIEVMFSIFLRLPVQLNLYLTFGNNRHQVVTN